jgi:hypothetical protein
LSDETLRGEIWIFVLIAETAMGVNIHAQMNEENEYVKAVHE